MRLSVILPCFNGAATITVQLDALARQEWADGWEVVVVNNGSTDNSVEIVEGYRNRLPGLKIVQAHVPGTLRLGVPHSYNTGIRAASGDAFVFCEADDEVGKGWLSAMGDALREHQFVVARVDHKKLNADWLHPHSYNGEGGQSAGLTGRQHYPYMVAASGCTFGLSRSLYEAVGPLSTVFPMVADAEYCWRAQLAGFKLHFEPTALVHYREKATLKGRFLQGRNWGRDFNRLLQYYGEPQVRLGSLRQLVWMLRCLPEGAHGLLVMGMRFTQGRHLLAEWVWNMGWHAGKLLARRKPLQPRYRVLTGPEGTVVVVDAHPLHKRSKLALLKSWVGRGALSMTLAAPEVALAEDKRGLKGAGPRINAQQEYELRDWALSLGVSREKLLEAVQTVGDDAHRVRDYLRQR